MSKAVVTMQSSHFVSLQCSHKGSRRYTHALSCTILHSTPSQCTASHYIHLCSEPSLQINEFGNKSIHSRESLENEAFYNLRPDFVKLPGPGFPLYCFVYQCGPDCLSSMLHRLTLHWCMVGCWSQRIITTILNSLCEAHRTVAKSPSLHSSFAMGFCSVQRLS